MTKRSDSFAHLHVHSDMSGFDGLGSPSDFVKRAVDVGQSTIAFTEHGTIRGLHESAKACAQMGVQYIPGCEFYLVEDATQRGLSDAEKEALKVQYPKYSARKEVRKQIERRLRERYHITVWASNQQGLDNLVKVSTWSWLEGFYYKPRIDFKRLEQFADGLIVTSGCCAGGVIPVCLRHREGDKPDYALACKYAEHLFDVFGDRFYIEIMPHVVEGIEGTHMQLLSIAKRLGVKVVATQDAHYTEQNYSTAQEILLAIQTNGKMSDPDRFRLNAPDYWMRTRTEMVEAFANNLPEIGLQSVKDALNTTLEIAERCDVKVSLEPKDIHFVSPLLPNDHGDYNDWLKALCRSGVETKFGGRFGDRYKERLAYELTEITEQGFAPYFIAVYDLRRWARKRGILSGPGRGSAAGSLVSYLLQITDLDPLEHGLSFDRFLAPGRQGYPDIDLDFDASRRDEILEHLSDKYGADRVAHISTHNRLKGRSTLRSIARVYELPEREILGLLPKIDDLGLDEALATTSEGQRFSTEHPDLAEYAVVLENNLRTVGLHAAGVVIADNPLAEIIPLESRGRPTGARVPAIAYDMAGAEDYGLVKLDVLGLSTLSLVRTALELAAVNLDDIDVNDPLTYEAFTRGELAGVFQFDTSSARKVCKGVEFTSLADVAVLTALNRPGPAQSGLADQYIARKQDHSKINSVHPIYDKVMEETYGVPVYQEQVIELVKQLCGYTPAEADRFRKKIGKKIDLADEEGKFVTGAAQNGMSKEDARLLFNNFLGFAQYAFNKSHAFSYATIAVWCQWLKIHHPGAFYAAALTIDDNPEKQLRLVSEARRGGLAVVPPNINNSANTFEARQTDSGVEIVGSLADIMHVGPVASKAIKAGAPYYSLLDFHDRSTLNGRVTSRTFASLARAGAFRELFLHHRLLDLNAKTIWGALCQGYKPELEYDITFPDYDEQQSANAISSVWPPYADVADVYRFEDLEHEISKKVKRKLSQIGDLTDGSHFVFGQLRSIKIYQGDKGRKGKGALASSNGDDIQIKIESDVLDNLPSALHGLFVLALVVVNEWGNWVDAAWVADDILDNVGIIRSVMEPVKTRPRDPAAVCFGKVRGTKVKVEGHILRVRKFVDRHGRLMARFGLLASHGYLPVLVFASVYEQLKRDIKIGNHIVATVENLGDAASLVAMKSKGA